MKLSILRDVKLSAFFDELTQALPALSPYGLRVHLIASAHFRLVSVCVISPRYDRDAPRAIADFDPMQFFARFEIDDGDVV